MRLYRETALRKRADEPTLAMLDLWRSLSEEKTGVPVEVMIGDRKKHRQLSSFSGELYAVFPQVIGEKVVLVLWLDSLSNVKPILVTHEIGHWVLKLQGFCTFLYQADRHNNVEIILNSMAHHPALYALQRSLGHEPQVEIDSRSRSDIKLFSKKSRKKEGGSCLSNALLLADDMMNCSGGDRIGLENVVSKNYPDILRLVKKIITLASSYNLLIADENLEFCAKVIEDLKLGSGWRKVDEGGELTSKVKEVEERKSNSG